MENIAINKSQKNMLDKVINYHKHGNAYIVKNIDIKKFDDGSDIYVSLVMGTEYNCAILESCYHFFIGARGGLYVYNDNCSKQYMDPWDLKSIW